MAIVVVWILGDIPHCLVIMNCSNLFKHTHSRPKILRKQKTKNEFSSVPVDDLPGNPYLMNTESLLPLDQMMAHMSKLD